MALLMKGFWCVLACLIATALRADEGSLGRGVPSDSVLYVRYRLDPSSEVGAALGGTVRETRVGLAVRNLVGLGLEALEAQPESSDASVDGASPRTSGVARWLSLVDAVPWSRLVSREVVLSARLEGERREFLLLFRLGDDLDRALAGLRRLAFATCALSPALEISESWHGSVKTLILYDLVQDEGLAFAGRDGVLLFATSPRLLRRSLQLFAGEGSDIGYHDASERVRRWKSLSGAPDPFPATSDILEVHVQVAGLLPDVPALGDVRSFTLGGWTQGLDFSYRFRTEFGSTELGRLRAILLDRSQVDPDSLRVPASATCCELCSGIDPRTLLSFVLELSLQSVLEVRPVLNVLKGWGLVGADSRGSSPGSTASQLWQILGRLRGRRVTVGFPDGIVSVVDLEDADSRADTLELLEGWWPALRERGFEIHSLDGSRLGAAAYRVVFPSSGNRSDGSRAEIVVGVSERHLALATSETCLREALAVASGSPGRSWTDLPIPALRRPRGDLLEIRFVDRAFLARSAGWVASALRGLSEARGGVPEGAQGLLRALTGAFSAVEGAVPVDWAVSAAARDGESLHGGGIFRFLRKEEGPAERQF